MPRSHAIFASYFAAAYEVTFADGLSRRRYHADWLPR
jgi:hypothetical protein